MTNNVRKQADAAGLATILDGLADGFYVLDGQGKITFLNKAARTILALTGDDPVGRHHSTAGPAGPLFAEKIRLAATAGETIYFETFAAGLEKWLEMLVCPAEDGVAVTFRDISERKWKQNRLLAFHDNPHAMALLSWPEAKFREVNEAWLQSMGFARSEVYGKSGAEMGMWAEDTRDALRKCLLEDGCVREREVAVRAKNGELLTALVSVEFINIRGEKLLMASSLDITGRKRAEELTREQLDLLEDLSDAVADVATLIVDEEGAILRFFGETGMFAGSPEGKRLGEVLPPPAAADLLGMLAAALLEGGSRTTEFKAGVGAMVKVIEVTASPMVRRYRDKRTVTLHVRDITATKAAEGKSAQAAQIYSRSTFFHSLLTGGHTGEYITGALENHGVDIHADYCCYVLQVTRDEPRQPEAWPSGETVAAKAAGKDDIVVWLAKHEPGWVWKSNGYIALLITADRTGRTKDDQVEFAHRLIRDAEARFAFTRVKVGAAAMSAAKGSALDLQDLHGKAVEALMLCGSWDDRSVVHHADTGLYQIAFKLLKDNNMLLLVEKTIGGLAAYDRAHENNLLTTLERILADENLRMVAAKLYIHHNTAIWRKKRIEQILGLSLDSFETRALVSMYLKVWKLSGQG